jgi:hypothetical protein
MTSKKPFDVDVGYGMIGVWALTNNVSLGFGFLVDYGAVILAFTSILFFWGCWRLGKLPVECVGWIVGLPSFLFAFSYLFPRNFGELEAGNSYAYTTPFLVMCCFIFAGLAVAGFSRWRSKLNVSQKVVDL